MDTTEKTRRLTVLREGLENDKNKKILDSALSSLICRLCTVTSEVFYTLVPLYPKNGEDYEDYEYDSDDDINNEEYNLIKDKLLDMLKQEK